MLNPTEAGVPPSIHAAAELGLIDRLAELLHSDPSLVHAKGCDGGTPLHFAHGLPTAELLVHHGAQIDARDDDHNSTPAQWRIREAPDVSRYLLALGAVPDIFMAAALGDIDLAAKLIAENPACVGQRIGRLPEFPPIGYQRRGGAIYQWTLAFNSYAHQVALLKGHRDIFELLYERSNPQIRLLVCCVLARREEAERIACDHPDIVKNLPSQDLELLPRYCWETNINHEAVRLMLDLGFPVAQTERSHGYSPLHNAAWCGNGELVDLLISRHHPVDLLDPGYHSTPFGFAIHDCLVEKRHPEADFAHVVDSLLKAGSPWDRSIYPTGNVKVDSVLARYL